MNGVEQLTLLPHAAPQADSDEWYSPADYADAARDVMGSIDLDPASCQEANRVIQATHFYSIEDNGLIRPWFGNLWMNPPFSRKKIVAFTDKLLLSLQEADVAQAIVLTNSATDTDWYQRLLHACCALCHPKGRLKFWGPNPQTYGPRLPQTVFYFTPLSDTPTYAELQEYMKRRLTFLRRFRVFGVCLDGPPQEVESGDTT